MSNLDALLLADETVSFHTQKNVVIFFMPVVWTIFAIFVVLQTHQFIASFAGLPLINSLSTLAWFPALMAIFSWLNQLLTYLTSDFIVTNQRVIMREGFFFRHSTETRLSAIAEIKIDQSILGKLMNFGSITVNSFGGGAEVFNAICSPYEFQRKVAEKAMKAG